MAKLKPIISACLEEENLELEMLISRVAQKTNVEKNKIHNRIKKMIENKELACNDNIVFVIQKETTYSLNVNGSSFSTTKENNQNITTINISEETRTDFFEKLEDVENITNDFLSDLETSFLNYNPLDILAFYSINLYISSFQENSLYTIPIQEIIQKILLKKPFYAYESSEKDISELESIFKKIHCQLGFYGMKELNSNLSKVEQEILMFSRLKFFFLRSDAYLEHYEEISKELFSQCDAVLIKKGFTIEKYWETLYEIKEQIEKNYDFSEMERLNKYYYTFKNKYSSEEIITNYNLKYGTNISTLGNNISNIGKGNSFKINPTPKINSKLLELISLQFGENSSWNHILDRSLVHVKPIIKYDDNYYCFLLHNLYFDVIPIIESLLTDEDKNQLNYSKIKGEYFEKKGLSLINSLIDGKLYCNLKYLDKEIDGIIVKDDLVFLIEIKGKKKRAPIGTDILNLIKSDFKAHINESFNQANNAYLYIKTNPMCSFKDNGADIPINFKDKKFYFINITLENFSILAHDVNLIKSWDSELLNGEITPWIVNIWDLMAMNKYLKENKQKIVFKKYINERIERSKESNPLKSFDELEFFCYYLKNKNLKSYSEDSTLLYGFLEEFEKNDSII
jgi:hypothetical protein